MAVRSFTLFNTAFGCNHLISDNFVIYIKNTYIPTMEQRYDQPYQPGQQPDYRQGYDPRYQQPIQQQQIIIKNQTNGLGTAGFVLALLAVVFCWVPFLDFILWLLGAIFSIIGLFKSPRGLAIAGTVISFIGIVIILVFFGALIGLSGLAAAGF